MRTIRGGWLWREGTPGVLLSFDQQVPAGAEEAFVLPVQSVLRPGLPGSTMGLVIKSEIYHRLHCN